MSNMSRVVIIIAVLVVFTGATWWYVRIGEENKTGLSVVDNQIKAPAGAQNAPVSANNSTDLVIGVDLQNVDLQLKSLDSDNSSVDQGLNDKPVGQLQ